MRVVTRWSGRSGGTSPVPGSRVAKCRRDSPRGSLGRPTRTRPHSPRLPPPGAREVEGVVVSADASAWDVQVIRVDYRGGTSQLWNRERVTFPRYALTNASQRAFNTKKSWLVALGITGTALLAARLFGVLGFGGGPNGEPPPPN